MIRVALRLITMPLWDWLLVEDPPYYTVSHKRLLKGVDLN